MGCQKLKTRYGDSEGILGGIFVALEGWVDGNFFFTFFLSRPGIWFGVIRGGEKEWFAVWVLWGTG